MASGLHHLYPDRQLFPHQEWPKNVKQTRKKERFVGGSLSNNDHDLWNQNGVRLAKENTGSLLFSDGYARSGAFEDERFSQSFRDISRGERRNGVTSVTSQNYPFLLRSPLPGKARSTNLSPISANFLDTSRSCVYSTANHTKQPIAANALNKANQ